MELTEEQQLCLTGIAKCDAFLQNWDMRGFEIKKDSIRFCESTDEVPPQKVLIVNLRTAERIKARIFAL